MSAGGSERLRTAAQGRVGQSVGKYELREVLGGGGMATVYAASHRNGHAVAVKILHDELAGDESVRRWFLREAYLANRVDHRGAVRVLDDDVTADGTVYLVLERLRGETVKAIWERRGRKLPWRAAALLAHDVLDVLAAAHGHGIVHRDIKPDNVFVTDDGDVKVLDFGIAHPLPVLGEATITATLRVAGTPAYMAPEQARGVVVREETDVWGTAATMYTLITGEYVHAGAPPPDLLMWVATRHARPVRELSPELPAPLAAVIDRGLAFEPEHRFPTAKAMRDALAEAFVESFEARVEDARDGVVADMRGGASEAPRALPAGNLHAITTQAPEPALDPQGVSGMVLRPSPSRPPGVQTLVWQNIVAVVDDGKADEGAYETWRDLVLERAAKYPAGLGCLIIVPKNATPPPEKPREALQQTLEALSGTLRCLCWLIEGTGFQGAMVRAVVTGLRFVTPTVYVTHIATDMDDALVWMMTQLHARPTRSALEAARREIEGQRGGQPLVRR